MAGGYDDRVTENVQHFAELKELAVQLHVEDCVTFLRSPSDSMKVALLRGSAAVLYTPSREHFGIVPVEAMYCCCPVIAVNSGGPLESVADGETGFLCEPMAEAFSKAMQRLVREPQLRRDMGQAGRRRVQDKFSLQAFSDQLYGYIVRLSQWRETWRRDPRRCSGGKMILCWLYCELSVESWSGCLWTGNVCVYVQGGGGWGIVRT